MLTLNHDYSMEVVRHYYKGVQCHVLIMGRKSLPVIFGKFADQGQLNIAPNDRAEVTYSSLRTDRDKIPARQTIVPI